MPQEFLKKEFSEENILFWQACELFSHVPENDKKQVAGVALLACEPCQSIPLQRRKMKEDRECDRLSPLIFLFIAFFSNTSSARSSRFLQLSQRAREIYNSFLSSKATTPVNIDSQAQLADDILNAPRPDMFKEQQLQVAHRAAHPGVP